MSKGEGAEEGVGVQKRLCMLGCLPGKHFCMQGGGETIEIAQVELW